MSHSQILKDKSITNGIQYLWNIIEQISQDPISEKARDFLTDLPNILYIILGAENKKGWLTQSFEDLNNPSRFSSVNSEENMRQLILLLSPPVISQQIESHYYKENIYTLLFDKELVEGQKFQLLSNVLPDHITELRKNSVWKHPSITRFQNLFSSEVSHITDQFIVISPGDWFLFALAFNLKKFRPSTSMKNARQVQDIEFDPYVHEFVQNPFLLLTRRYLEYFDFLSLSQMQEHKDKKNLFKKFCFILEEHLMVEQIFNIHPHNIEILLHYSILDGLQYSEVRQSYPARKKSLNAVESDSTSTISGDSKLHGNMYESQLSGGSKLGGSQISQVHQQQQHNLTNLSGSTSHNQQSSLIQSTTDIIDNFSGYSKNNILQHFMAITNIKEFYGKKGKDSFTVHSNYIFQALLILLHYKRRHFKLLTISSLYSTATSSNLRGNSSINNYYSLQGSQRNSTSSMIYGNQGSRKQSTQTSSYANPYSTISNPQMSNYNSQYSKSSQQYFIRLRQQYMKYREFDNMDYTIDQFQLEYFRDHGEDNMLTLFFKKLCFFLSISLDDWQKDVTKQAKETLYDQGRLLASLIGHHKYFEKKSCENDLFSYLTQVDEYILSNSISSRNSASGVVNQVQNNAATNNVNASLGGNTYVNSTGLFGLHNQQPPSVPLRPVSWSYCLNDSEFEKLLPSLYVFDSTRYGSSGSYQNQYVSTTYRQQIGYFNEELSQIRFKILASSCTLLLNKFTSAFSSIKELTLSDYLIFALLIDIVFKKRENDERSINNSMSYTSKGVNQEEDLITRLNNLDLVTIKHANEFFLLRENDDIYRVFITPESLEPLRKIITLITSYLKKKGSQKSAPINVEIDGSFYLPPDETDPVQICSYLQNKLNYILKISYSNAGFSNNNTFKDASAFDRDGRRDTSFQIENRRPSYNFQSWSAPLASFESKILFYVFLQLSFFIDFAKNGFYSPLPPAKYPRTNLRKYANIYVTFSYLLLIIFLIFILRWFFSSSSTTHSSSNYSSTYKRPNQYAGNTKSKFQWDLD